MKISGKDKNLGRRKFKADKNLDQQKIEAHKNLKPCYS